MSIATFIKDDLAARLVSGVGVPSPLTIDALAEHYQVSFTPVRTAVAELIDEGLLKRGSNRRLSTGLSQKHGTSIMRRSVPPTPSFPPTPSLPPNAFELIAHDLVELSLHGEAIFLREEATAEKYQISRSAIRNLLHRLAGEGILDHIPRRGWRLRPFRRDELQAYIAVREVLELKAVDLAIGRLATDRLFEILEANLEPAANLRKAPVDESLHDYLVECSGNSYIRDFFERQGRYYRLLFRWEDLDQAVAEETRRQHRTIVTALLDQDWQTAREELSAHILDNHPVLQRLGNVPLRQAPST